jgi:hypothetical protein
MTITQHWRSRKIPCLNRLLFAAKSGGESEFDWKKMLAPAQIVSLMCKLPAATHDGESGSQRDGVDGKRIDTVLRRLHDEGAGLA